MRDNEFGDFVGAALAPAGEVEFEVMTAEGEGDGDGERTGAGEVEVAPFVFEFGTSRRSVRGGGACFDLGRLFNSSVPRRTRSSMTANPPWSAKKRRFERK